MTKWLNDLLRISIRLLICNILDDQMTKTTLGSVLNFAQLISWTNSGQRTLFGAGWGYRIYLIGTFLSMNLTILEKVHLTNCFWKKNLPILFEITSLLTSKKSPIFFKYLWPSGNIWTLRLPKNFWCEYLT